MNVSLNTLGPSKLKAGVGNYVYQLVWMLAKIDNKNQYYVIVNKDNANLFQIKKKNFHIIKAPNFTTTRILRILWEQTGLSLLCWRHKIDILHSTGFVAPLFLPCKSVVTIHDMTFFSHPEYHEISKIRYFRALIPRSARKAAAISADSENTRREITKYLGISSGKIKTIHLAGNPSCVQVEKKEAKQLLKNKYSISSEFILFVGTIEPRKNIAGLIDSYAKAKVAEKLVIVGKKGWMYEEIFVKIKKHKIEEKVIFTGFVPEEDLKFFYSAAELFIYPSFYEGFGLPILEAMQCGCPVITSNISSVAEIAGDAAVLIDPHKDFSNEIKLLLADKNKQEELRQKGFKQAKKFSWEKCAGETLELYTNISQL